MTMAAATTKLGLASTCSTTYFEPFDVAATTMTSDSAWGAVHWGAPSGLPGAGAAPAPGAFPSMLTSGPLPSTPFPAAPTGARPKGKRGVTREATVARRPR